MTGDDIATIIFLWMLPAILFVYLGRMAWKAFRMLIDPDYEPTCEQPQEVVAKQPQIT